jgi:hypothetical protein
MKRLALLRPGDWLVLAGALALVIWLALVCWQQQAAARVRIYQDGRLFAELDLALAKTLQVPGPLGLTTVEIMQGRVRIARDPSPRQYCVREGWLTTAGQLAICLPNRTSIELIGRGPRDYDSLNY